MLFGDETSLSIDGPTTGMSLASIGALNVRVKSTNEKENVNVFLAGIYDVSAKKALPLPPTVIFQSSTKEENSRILKDLKSVENKFGKIYFRVTESGWTQEEIYPPT